MLICSFTSGTSDPYVKFKLGNRQVYRSKTISKTLNPVWNEHFTTILDNINQILSLRVYDYDFGFQDDYLGTASIDLMKVKWNE
jgi:Ca2+-dependent lipid-binding protein